MSAVELNAPQQAAVEHGQGPLLIVAGAGTGKTRVIVERVGYLLGTVEALQPEQVLALTFANKAAGEMRQRARERFGEQAGRCRFSTFHSFCYELLAETGPSRALDRIDQWIFLRRNLEALELDYYFKTSEPGRFLADLVDFASRCHDNLVTPAEYSQYIERLAADCASKAGAPSPGCDEAEIARQKEVSRVFALLEQLQEEQGLLSFGSMISRAVRLLDDSPELLRRLQQRYQYILVDEFQDTNTAQFELLVRLSGTRKNLAVVGDDDQAIYRFRGASFASFEQFAERYPEHMRIVLDRNYRSTRKILTVAGAAIASNSQDRYMPDKKLVTDNDAGPEVEVWEFADDVAQAEYTAQHIGESMHQGAVKSYSEFAVLYRAHNHRNRLVEALRRRGIPFAIRNLAVNNLSVIRDLVAALRVIGNARGDPADSVSLVRVLADPRWQMGPELLRRYCREAVTQRKILWEVIEQSAPEQDWKGRQGFLEFLRRFRALAEQERLADWFPLLTAEMGLPRSLEERPAFTAFSEFVTRWDKEKCSSGLLSEFLEYFQYFEEAGGTIALGEPSEGALGAAVNSGAQQQLWAATDEAISEEANLGKVQLMTVHAAKGLEFERVIVWNLVRRAFPTTHRRPLIELPPALWKGPLPRGDFHIEEERRLFYVALTRARHSLVLSTISNPKQRPSIFLDQLQDVGPPHLVRTHPVHSPVTPPVEPVDGKAPAAADAGARLAEWVAAPVPPEEEFTLSISQLDTYLECPLKYHFRHQWKIPVPAPPPLLFGIIVHGALKEVMAAVAQNSDGTLEEKIREILDRRWPKTGFPDPVQERKYRELGLEQLVGAAQDWGKKGIVLLYQEKSFEIRSGGCRLVGRIDQLHRIPGGGVELVEYKTGRPQTQKEADRSQQITLYARACRQ
ncbi:MAG: hypothetical protein A3H94_07775, partial [Acidobacteria bacterium RIFCSPLOWO2_02_FULL_60_20]